jgi:hypothetical protein
MTDPGAPQCAGIWPAKVLKDLAKPILPRTGPEPDCAFLSEVGR